MLKLQKENYPEIMVALAWAKLAKIEKNKILIIDKFDIL
jgi:hypothetical protein